MINFGNKKDETNEELTSKPIEDFNSQSFDDFPDVLGDESNNFEGPSFEDVTIEKLDNLERKFDERIKYDKWKDDLFDSLHKELQTYRNGLLDKNLESMALDIIQIMDTYRKLLDTMDTSPEKDEKTIKTVSNIIIDLEDSLYRQGIEPYETDDTVVDVKKQKIISTVATSDISKNNTIAKKFAPGYEHEGKIIRQERIAIYKYKEEETNE